MRARVHIVARRRCGGVAARGARAAGGESADHRLLGLEHGFHPEEAAVREPQKGYTGTRRWQRASKISPQEKAPLGAGLELGTRGLAHLASLSM